MRSIKAILFITLLSFTSFTLAQSPKKYFENGMYEQAFVEAVYKQNKKVKLKKKFTQIIYPSYDKIYAAHGEVITSRETNWEQSYNALIRVVTYRSKVRHQGVYDNLKNILYDTKLLNHLGNKFNEDNQKDISKANKFEYEEDYEKALELYKGIALRHEQAEPITTLEDRIEIIDHEEKIEHANQKIGDLLIAEASEMLGNATSKSAKSAIKLIEEARTYRPLSVEEESLLELAHLFMSNSLIQDAEKMLQTPTKKNARLAYELIERVRSMRTLTPEEERLSEKAEKWGMTRVLVSVKGVDAFNTNETLTGYLNKSKNSKWISYYHVNDPSITYDFELEVTENKPSVVLGKTRKEISQESKTVEYFEDETDDQGNTVQVKKTRQAVAVVATLSRTKSAFLSWTAVVVDLSEGKAAHSETRESVVEITNQFASVESGDVLALPDNIETEVDLDSQPFPSDKDMIKQVKDLYLSEFFRTINDQNLYLENLNDPIK